VSIMLQLSRVAGTDRQLLARCPRSSQIKYGALGGLLLLLSLLSSGAFTYALYVTLSVPDQTLLWMKMITFGIGLFWLIMILNLFRLLVSSTGSGDGIASASKPELFSALLSTTMAIFLGICFGVSVSVMLFHNSLRFELSNAQIVSIKEFNSNVDTQYHDKFKQAYIQKAMQFEKLVTVDRTRKLAFDKARRVYIKQLSAIKVLRQEVVRKKSSYQESVINSNGFFTMASKVIDKHSSIVALLLLFGILIHIFPILAKRIFWVKDPYEYLLEYQNELTLAEHGIVRNTGRFVHGGKTYSHDRYSLSEQLLSANITALQSNLQSNLLKHEELFLGKIDNTINA